jgi:hypothetical protein
MSLAVLDTYSSEIDRQLVGYLPRNVTMAVRLSKMQYIGPTIS